MHQKINKSRRQQGLCMRISASKSPKRTQAHGKVYQFALMKEIPYPGTYESNFIHHDFAQFGKQHSPYTVRKFYRPLFHHNSAAAYTSSLLQ